MRTYRCLASYSRRRIKNENKEDEEEAEKLAHVMRLLSVV